MFRRLNALSVIRVFFFYIRVKKVKHPVTGLQWPRRFQEVKFPRFHDNGTGCC